MRPPPSRPRRPARWSSTPTACPLSDRRWPEPGHVRRPDRRLPRRRPGRGPWDGRRRRRPRAGRASGRAAHSPTARAGPGAPRSWAPPAPTAAAARRPARYDRASGRPDRCRWTHRRRRRRRAGRRPRRDLQSSAHCRPPGRPPRPRPERWHRRRRPPGRPAAPNPARAARPAPAAGPASEVRAPVAGTVRAAPPRPAPRPSPRWAGYGRRSRHGPLPEVDA